MTAADKAAEVLITHTRTRIEDCHCGWGVNTGALGQSHARHVAQALADAGLLADLPAREQYASLDQLQSGDLIVWTRRGEAIMRELRRAEPWDDAVYILKWADGDRTVVNASLLVRRIHNGGQS